MGRFAKSGIAGGDVGQPSGNTSYFGSSNLYNVAGYRMTLPKGTYTAMKLLHTSGLPYNLKGIIHKVSDASVLATTDLTLIANSTITIVNFITPLVTNGGIPVSLTLLFSPQATQPKAWCQGSGIAEPMYWDANSAGMPTTNVGNTPLWILAIRTAIKGSHLLKPVIT